METSNIKSQNKKIYSAYDQHITCNLSCPSEEDKTKQAFGSECNINSIMAKYEKTGVIDSNPAPPQYGDAPSFDFQEAQNIVIQAQTMFNALPATIRSKFDNNPHLMLNWMDNPENEAQAIALGLLKAAERVGMGGHPIPTLEVASTPLKTPAIDLQGNPIPSP